MGTMSKPGPISFKFGTFISGYQTLLKTKFRPDSNYFVSFMAFKMKIWMYPSMGARTKFRPISIKLNIFVKGCKKLTQTKFERDITYFASFMTTFLFS